MRRHQRSRRSTCCLSFFCRPYACRRRTVPVMRYRRIQPYKASRMPRSLCIGLYKYNRRTLSLFFKASCFSFGDSSVTDLNKQAFCKDRHSGAEWEFSGVRKSYCPDVVGTTGSQLWLFVLWTVTAMSTSLHKPVTNLLFCVDLDFYLPGPRRTFSVSINSCGSQWYNTRTE